MQEGMPWLPFYCPRDAWDDLRELTLMHDLASEMWWAERARLYVWSPEFHDCCRDFPLIQHPQALCSLFLSVFSIFPVGSCCAQLGQLVKRGNEERRVDLGPLIDDGGGLCGPLRLPFDTLVLLNEACVGLDECL